MKAKPDSNLYMDFYRKNGWFLYLYYNPAQVWITRGPGDGLVKDFDSNKKAKDYFEKQKKIIRRTC